MEEKDIQAKNETFKIKDKKIHCWSWNTPYSTMWYSLLWFKKSTKCNL
jgi:hypothetical protein